MGKKIYFFHNNQHPKEMSASHVEHFLHHLAVIKNVSVVTQKMTLNTLAFLDLCG